jgi:hypothetical protein
VCIPHDASRFPLPAPAHLRGGRDLQHELAFDCLEVERLQHFVQLRVLRDLVAHARVETGHELQRLGHFFFETQPHLE